MSHGADGTVRVLVVDPMPLARKALVDVLRPCVGLAVVGAVSGTSGAERRLAEESIDVVLLDVEPPVAAAIAPLSRLRTRFPFQIVLFTALEGAERQALAQACAVGPLAVIVKPSSGLLSGTQALKAQLVAALMEAVPRRQVPGIPLPHRVASVPPVVDRIVAIGASTGGTEALATVLGGLGRATPGLVIVQHMPPGFTASFARRLDAVGELAVKEAQDGDLILPGHALLAPGARHMTVEPGRDGLVVRVEAGPPVNGHRPSVDVLMLSVAQHAGRHGMGVLLTGMGNDGALGMRAIRDAGGLTIGQDKATSIVYGMPKMALEAGGVAHVAPLSEIAGHIVASLRRHA